MKMKAVVLQIDRKEGTDRFHKGNLGSPSEIRDYNYRRKPTQFSGCEAKWQSRNPRDNSECKLTPKLFREI